MYIHMFISLSLSLYIYIYIYVERERERHLIIRGRRCVGIADRACFDLNAHAEAAVNKGSNNNK